MKETEFIHNAKLLKSTLDQFKQSIDLQYTNLAKQFITANSPVALNKVYEVLSGPKIRLFKRRMVIYKLNISILHGKVVILAGCWWLGTDNVPYRWETVRVYGPKAWTFKLAADQTAQEHPDANQMRALKN